MFWKINCSNVFPPSAFVAGGLLSRCWDPAAAPAGPVSSLSGPQEKTTGQAAQSPRRNSMSVLTRTHSFPILNTHFH